MSTTTPAEMHALHVFLDEDLDVGFDVDVRYSSGSVMVRTWTNPCASVPVMAAQAHLSPDEALALAERLIAMARRAQRLRDSL